MDATLTILRTTDAYSFLWLPHGAAPLLSTADRNIPAVALAGTTTIAPAIHQSLRQAMDEVAQLLNVQSPSASVTPVVNLGRALYSQTIPPSIQATLAHMPDQANLTLVTDDADLPWELLHDGQEFLALRHQVGRILPHTEWPRQPVAPARAPLKCLLLGNPTRDLPGAAAEIEALTDLLDGRRDLVVCESFAGDRITKAHVLQLLASGNYDLIHFAGHARPGALHLADGWLETPFIQNAVKGQPVVYLNACASARDLQHSDLQQAEQATQNLASTFLRGSAAAVIGMLWPLPDQSSARLSLDFYRELLRGATLGEALRQSRVALRSSPAAGVAWLAPVLYGDPRRRPVRASLIQRPGTVLAVRFPDPAARWQGQPLETLSSALQQQLHTLRNLVTAYGGVVVEINSTGMTALFGVYGAVEQDALAAVRAAVEIRSNVATWGSGAPQIGVASGDLAAEPLAALVAQPETPLLRQPFLIGAPVSQAFALAQSAESGQIGVNALTARSVQQRYRFADTAQGKVLVQAVEPVLSDPTTPPSIQPSQSIGRGRELQRLRDEWALVARRQGRVIGLVGEAGVGKSHLLAEFGQTLEQAPGRWLALACTPDRQNTPYSLLAQLFRRLLDLPTAATADEAATQIESRLAGAAGTLQRNPAERTALLLDLLGYLPAQPSAPSEHAGQQAVYQSRLLAPLQFLVAQAVKQQPLALVVEDAHWLDAATQQLLTHLTDSMRGLPILLLLSYRPGWEHGWYGKPYYHHLALDELERDACRQLLQSYLQSEELPPALLDLPERLGGNPLFLIETLRSLQERGILQPQATGWSLQQSLTVLQLPDTVQRTLQLRFGQLDDAARRILEIAALIGLHFDPTLLAQIAGVEEFALLPQLAQLQAREFIYQDWGSELYTFRHAAIQEAAYAEIALPERRVWHARVAQVLEERMSQDAAAFDTLAQHYYLSLVRAETAADDPVLIDHADPHLAHTALTYLLQSGERALERYGLQEARRAFRRAGAVTALLAPQADQHYPLRAQVEAGLGNTYDILGERPLALHHLRQAYALLHAQPLVAASRRRAGDLARRIARLYAWRRDYATAFAWIEAGLEKVAAGAEAADQAVVALLHIHAGSIYYNQSDYDAAVRAFETGIAVAQTVQAEAALAEGYHLLGAVAQMRSQYDLALQHYAACLAIRQQHNDLYQIARVTGNLGVVYFDQADWPHARAQHEQARLFWQEIGDRDMLAHTSLNLGNVFLCLGDWPAAQRYFEEALALWSDLDSQKWIALCHNNLGLLAIEQEAWGVARQHLSLNQAAPFPDIRLEAHYALAEVELGQAQHQAAGDLAAQAVTLAESLQLQRELALALRIHGRALAAVGEIAAGCQRLEESQALLTAAGVQYEAARTVYRLAEVEAAAGNRAQAGELALAAQAIFQAVQAQKDWERVQRLLETL